jgi:hypothetical protein
MSCSASLLQILEFSNGLNQFSELSLIDLSSSNSLFSFSPQLLDFSSECSGCFNSLFQEVTCRNNLFGGFQLSDSCNSCLEELLVLEELLFSDSDSNDNDNDINNNSDSNDDNSDSNDNSNLNNSLNSTDISNSTYSLVSSNSSSLDNSTSVSNVTAAGSKKSKGKAGKRSEILMQRSGSSRLQALTGLGVGTMVLFGVLSL